MAKDICVLAYSGGLDTSVCVRWLMDEMGLDVVCVVGEVGQEHEGLEQIKQRALEVGAIDCIVADMRETFANEYLTRALAANSMFENKYPLVSALSRPLISQYLVEVAHKYGAKYVAHGCTGKGNDQVRFENSIRALDPELEIIAPVRVWEMRTRDDEMEWAAAHGVKVPTTKNRPYSIDDNMWGRAIECGVLEDTWNKPPADIWTMTKNLDECPADPEEIVISFEQGIPTAINGEKMPLLDLIIKCNEIAGHNGFGRIDMIEDRVVGIKSRECYECPAALLLIQAHQSLEQLCLDAETLKQKAKLDVEWASTVYRGLWFSQNRNAIDAFNAYTQKYVTGDVRIILCKGGLFVDGLRSDYSLYDYNLATYDEGDTFDHTAARGFIDLHGLQSKTWSRVQGPGSGLQSVE